MNKFIDALYRYAEEKPSSTLITIDGISVSYGEFKEYTEKISMSLNALGISENKKVGLIIPNSLQWYKIFWSAIRIGAQPVPVDPQSGEMELSRLLDLTDMEICFIACRYRNNNILNTVKNIIEKYSNIRHVIVIDSLCTDFNNSRFMTFEKFISAGKSMALSDVHNVDDKHVMSLACTSGSTGNPKILSVPYNGFYDAIKDISDYLEFNSKDTMMIGMPLYHQGGFGMGMQVVVKGGNVIYQPQFEPIEFLKTVAEKKVTVVQLTSTLAKILLSVPDFFSYDMSSVKVCYFAGEVLPKEIAKIFVEKLNIRVINVIGSSETATMVVWDSENDYDTDPSDFRELPFTKVRVLDENDNEVDTGMTGELCIYTSAVIFNYYKNSDESAAKIIDFDNKRWFKTGDLVEKLSDGRIRFVGRSKRIIKRGANLVNAEEVESFLISYPKIQAVAVTAEDHPIIGQQIVAYIQSVEGQNVTRGELARYFDGKMSAYKLPDKVIMTEDLPKDIGKIQFKYIRK